MSSDDDTCHKYTRILDVDDDTNVQLCYIRVYTGFEWNKYNQTHYDFDNPPPKILLSGPHRQGHHAGV